MKKNEQTDPHKSKQDDTGLVFRVNNFVVELWLRSRCDCKRVYITLAGTNLEGVVLKANG